MKHFLSNLDLHSETPQDYESIIFGAGCFWGVEKKFWQLDGVWLTSVGYSGGELEDPSYEIVCSGTTNHVEVVKVEESRKTLEYIKKILLENMVLHHQ